MSQDIKIAVRCANLLSQRRDVIADITFAQISVELVGKAERIYGRLTIEVPIEKVKEWANTAGVDIGQPMLYAPEIAKWIGIGYTR